MLLSLHVKDFAIIDELEIDFYEHLNILTGETGSGKSILIGSIGAVLGGKISKEMVRKDAEYALIDLLFETTNPMVFDKMKELDLNIEDSSILFSRKIMSNGRSVMKINGEMASLGAVQELAALLLDIHGQHEHQSLLYKKNHLEILDRFGKESLTECKNEVREAYTAYSKSKKELDHETVDEDKRRREIDLLSYEVNEINAARLISGEESSLENAYRKLSNSKIIQEAVGAAYNAIGGDNESAAYLIGKAVKQLARAAEFDQDVASFESQIRDIESLLDDLNRFVAEYMEEIEDSQEELAVTAERLDLIHSLEAKYGRTIEDILQFEKEASEKLEHYLDYDAYLIRLQKQTEENEKRLHECSFRLSDIRKKTAARLETAITEALKELNFLEVRFQIKFETASFGSNGCDEAEYMISLNPGEEVQPLGKVASGGELSRIMLAIKSVMADKDAIETLIFDEIDTGISGRTAQKVSERLSIIAKNHQVLCITHLPQIASMADTHYLIEKTVAQNKTTTLIRHLAAHESVDEIARMLGGAEITESVRNNAKEMLCLADDVKKKIRK